MTRIAAVAAIVAALVLAPNTADAKPHRPQTTIKDVVIKPPVFPPPTGGICPRPIPGHEVCFPIGR